MSIDDVAEVRFNPAFGRDGENAFGLLGANFTQPPVNSNVDIVINPAGWVAGGQTIYIETGGVYRVISRAPGSNSVTVQNLGTSGAAAYPTVIVAGARCAPSGEPGLGGGGGGGIPTSRTVTAGAGLTGGGDLSVDRTIDVVANVDGSIVVSANDVKVGILASDAQHGSRGGGSTHSVAIAAGAAGFMSGAQASKLNSVATGADVTGSNPPQAHAASHKASGSDALVPDFSAPNTRITTAGTTAILTIPLTDDTIYAIYAAFEVRDATTNHAEWCERQRWSRSSGGAPVVLGPGTGPSPISSISAGTLTGTWIVWTVSGNSVVVSIVTSNTGPVRVSAKAWTAIDGLVAA